MAQRRFFILRCVAASLLLLAFSLAVEGGHVVGALIVGLATLPSLAVVGILTYVVARGDDSVQTDGNDAE